jgi:hypothetical protein
MCGSGLLRKVIHCWRIPISLMSGAPVFTQRASARTSVNQGKVNRNANINANKNYNANVNKNVNVNVNKNVYVHSNSYYGGGCCYHTNTAAVVATTSIVTAAVVGSRVYALPPACSVVIVNGLTYQHCGSTWERQQQLPTQERGHH